MSFISLINPSYINKKRIIADFSKYLLLMAVMWPCVILGSQYFRRTILIFSSIYFFIDVLRLVIILFKAYKLARLEAENYYSEDVNNFFKWIYKSVIYICILFPTAMFFIFASRFYNAIFMSLGTAIFCYIFISFQNYILHYKSVSKVLLNESNNKIDFNNTNDLENIIGSTIASSYNDNLHIKIDGYSQLNNRMLERLAEWCSNKKYLKNGITVASLALEVGTNRTEMSAFINREYKCNFREWINNMRINEAKRMLLADNLTVEQVSINCGFSSSSFFIKQFIKATGDSPAKWRKIIKFNLENNNIIIEYSLHIILLFVRTYLYPILKSLNKCDMIPYRPIF
jgi:AraC-type DNA-binding domain-containing proteins